MCLFSNFTIVLVFLLEQSVQLVVPPQVNADQYSLLVSYLLQCDGPIDDIIEHKCKILGKCTGKDKAFHLAQWMRGELDRNENSQTWSEPEIETWSEEMLQRRTECLDINFNRQDNVSYVTEINMQSNHDEREANTNYERSPVSGSLAV